MGGGLMQLVAYGAQDIYLTGNPQITFFKVVYRRHTNFAMETIEQTINGTSTLTTSSSTGTVTISRNGDLVSKVYVTTSSVINNGSKLVSEVELEIGGQRIDKHYEEWNNIWNELTVPSASALAFRAMQCTGSGAGGADAGAGPGMTQIPLNFWFCRNPGLALPLIALQYHEVKLKFTWGTVTAAASQQQTDVGLSATCKVWCDYVYLDTDERRRFAQVSHEYLIEQLQKESYTNAAGDHKLNFNHPVKELIWTSPSTNAYDTAKLVLNGHDRFSVQEEEYFQLRQPIDHHTRAPNQNIPSGAFQHNNSNILVDAPVVSEAYNATTEVTTDKVRVSKDTNGGSIYRIGELAVTTGIAVNPGTIAYTFLGNNLNHNIPQVGEMYQFAVTGEGSVSNDTTDVTTVNAVVTAVRLGGGPGATHLATDSDGKVSTVHVCIKLDTLLTEATMGAAIVTNFTINSMKLIQPALTSGMVDKINCYSFALKPEEHQPSGTCNFSRIDNAKLNFGTAPGGVGRIYAVNYNVLRIMSCMGGLAYSN